SAAARKAVASASVTRAGTCIGPSALGCGGLAAAAVPLAQGIDQALDAALADDRAELAAVGLDEPDPEDVDVVDLPVLVGSPHPVVELDRLGSLADHFAAHDDVLVGRVGPQGFHADRLVAHFGERARIRA